MKSLKVVLAIAFLAGIGCAKGKSSDLYSPPPVISENGAKGSGIKVDFNPQLDVLFVIDNSASMKDEQARLRDAISRFVHGFGENSFIDYRVGVITVYDSQHCGKPNKHNDFKTWECYTQGKLQPVKDAQGNVIANSAYVQRGEGAAEILKATLNVGALELKDNGPETEEMFNPILTAVSPEMNAGANHGFFRPDSHKVIVIVSDEDDASIELTSESFLANLYTVIPAEKLSLYGVLAVGGCARQSFAEAPVRLEQAISRHGGKTYRICDITFGASLANMGDNIRRKLYRINPIILPTVPEAGTLKLFYGDTEIPAGKGWSYDIRLRKITIDSTLDVPFVEGRQFRAAYTEVSATSIRKGRVQRANP